MEDIYVNSEAMIAWKDEMNTINTNCAEEVGKINGYINTLTSSYFKGDYADDFSDSITQFATTVQSAHTAMASVEGFLTAIVEEMNKE